MYGKCFIAFSFLSYLMHTQDHTQWEHADDDVNKVKSDFRDKN